MLLKHSNDQTDYRIIYCDMVMFNRCPVDISKVRRRVNLEPEWRCWRPVAINVDAAGRIFVLEATRHRLQVYMHPGQRPSLIR